MESGHIGNYQKNVNNTDTAPDQKTLQHGQKLRWTSKFNSIGSTSAASVTTRASTAVLRVAGDNMNNQVSICLECKDVVENIGLKNKATYITEENVLQPSIAEHIDDSISGLPVQVRLTNCREIRQLHTQSLIFQ